MKKTSRLWIVIALEIIAVEIGAYTYAALLFHDRLHVLLLTGLLCLVAGMIGTVVTRAKAQAASCAILLLGLLALGIGLYFRVHLHYHERAAAALGIGLLGFLGGLAGLLMPRSRAASLGGLLVLGLITLSIGLYCLTILGYHGRAYMVLGTGTLCLLGSLAGYLVIQYRTSTAGR
jgi:hypothetical protein